MDGKILNVGLAKVLDDSLMTIHGLSGQPQAPRLTIEKVKNNLYKSQAMAATWPCSSRTLR